jgi:hypothetical protein
LESTVVIYTTKEGWREFRRVPNGYPPTLYNSGIVIGPPNLDSLELTKKQKLKINNYLVDEGVISYENLLGKKRLLLNVLLEMGFKELKAVQIRNSIIGIYQTELLTNSEDM